MLSLAFRFMTGFAIGFEFAPAPGVYFSAYLCIVEVALYNEEGLDNE